jgi:hypothetical protein
MTPWFFMKTIGRVAHRARQALAFVERRGEAGVVVVVGDLAVEERRRLARGQQAVVVEHVERHRPRLVGVQDHARAGDAVDRRVDALRRELERAAALEHAALLVEDDQLARARFRPVQAVRQDQVLPVAARHGNVKWLSMPSSSSCSTARRCAAASWTRASATSRRAVGSTAAR